MSIERFSGILAPVVTPFKDDLSPDIGRFLNHCRWVKSQNANLAIFGTNSEANSLSVKEKIDLLENLISSGISGDALMPGTGCCSFSETVELTNAAVSLGCRGVLMLPPFYYKGVTDDGLFAYFSEVIERVNNDRLSIYLYHIPPMSQIPLSTDLVTRLVTDYPEAVVGIKDSSGDWKQTEAFNKLKLPNFRVFCGSESFLLQNMEAGGAGCISATANVNSLAINELFLNWTMPGAAQKQKEINEIRDIFQHYPMIPALKEAIALNNEDAEWSRVRPPLVSLSRSQSNALKMQLEQVSFTMNNLFSRQ